LGMSHGVLRQLMIEIDQWTCRISPGTLPLITKQS
jgi:hypothetical protein